MDEPKAPQNSLFYKIFSQIMALVGMGPCNWWWYQYPKLLKYFFKFQALSTAVLSSICFSSQFVFLFQNNSRLDKNALGIVYSIIPIGFLVSIKSACSRTTAFKKLLADFMDKIHLYNYYRNNKNEFVKMKLIQVERLTALVCLSLFIFMYCDWLAWMVTPVLYNIRNIETILNGTGSFHTCLYMWMPFDYLNDYNNWLIQNVVNAYITFLAVIIIVTFDMICYILIFNLIGHIQILKHNMRTRFVDTINDDDTKQKLIDIIQHHCFITETFKEVQHVFGLSVAANYLQNLLEDGLLMYQCMLGDKESLVTYGLTLVYYMGGLVTMSLVLEEIRRETEDLSDTLYSNIPWETMSLSNQKSFAIILAKFQPILEFQALGCFVAGIKPAISIIKTTFSYYVMLKARM